MMAECHVKKIGCMLGTLKGLFESLPFCGKMEML